MEPLICGSIQFNHSNSHPDMNWEPNVPRKNRHYYQLAFAAIFSVAGTQLKAEEDRFQEKIQFERVCAKVVQNTNALAAQIDFGSDAGKAKSFFNRVGVDPDVFAEFLNSNDQIDLGQKFSTNQIDPAILMQYCSRLSEAYLNSTNRQLVIDDTDQNIIIESFPTTDDERKKISGLWAVKPGKLTSDVEVGLPTLAVSFTYFDKSRSNGLNQCIVRYHILPSQTAYTLETGTPSDDYVRIEGRRVYGFPSYVIRWLDDNSIIAILVDALDLNRSAMADMMNNPSVPMGIRGEMKVLYGLSEDSLDTPRNNLIRAVSEGYSEYNGKVDLEIIRANLANIPRGFGLETVTSASKTTRDQSAIVQTPECIDALKRSRDLYASAAKLQK